jgi:hypothetical protein
MLAMWPNYQGSVDQVEENITIGCDLGTSNHTLVVYTLAALRTRLILKGEGMLGYDPNPSSWVIS